MAKARDTKAAEGRWLFKTDPDTYGYADLEAKPMGDVWDGVANAVALKHLRNVKAGDQVLIYHTGDEKAIVGLAQVARGPYPDPNQDDEKATVVDVKAVRRAKAPLTLAEIKKDPRYAEFDLVRLSRLSVMPVPPHLWRDLIERSGL